VSDSSSGNARVSTRRVYDGRVIDLDVDTVRFPNGTVGELEMIRHPGASAVVPFLSEPTAEDPQVLLIRQYRYAAEQYLYEVPAGRLDPGESPLQAAKRELTEETGYKARKWTKLVSFYASPGFVAEKMTIFLATNLTGGEAQPMDDEKIETRWFTPAEIESMIKSGKILDGKTMIGYFTWKRFF